MTLASMVNKSMVANGRRGGLATLEKYGRIHFVLLGMRGGRPTWRRSLMRGKETIQNRICRERAASGATTDRPGYRALMADADRRRFDLVMVWALDRFGRSLRQLVTDLELFRVKGIGFRSHTQAIDTTSPGGMLLFQIMAAFAEFERSLTVERVRAGLEAARAKGKRLGRPPVDPAIAERVREMAWEGRSIAQIAAATKLPRSTIAKLRRENKDT